MSLNPLNQELLDERQDMDTKLYRWTDQDQPPVLCRWPEALWNHWQPTNWANQHSVKCIRWHQDGIWIGQVCKGIIQERQESFTWGNPTEWQPSDKDLDQAETYKYLGMEEGEGVQHHKMKVKITKEYRRRIKLVLKSELNARNKIAATNTLAVPVICYSYGVIDWKLGKTWDLDRMTRKQLCMNWMLGKKADVDRIYLPC